MDRLERSLRLCLKTATRERRNYRESRLTVENLGAYVKALQERDSAKEAFAARPGDSEAREILRQAQVALDQARDELKH